MQEDKNTPMISLAAEIARIRAQQRAKEASARQLEAAQEMMHTAVGTGEHAAGLVPDLAGVITRLRAETQELEARASQLEAASEIVQNVLGPDSSQELAPSDKAPPVSHGKTPNAMSTITSVTKKRRAPRASATEDTNDLLGHMRSIANSHNDLAVGERQLLRLIGLGLGVTEASHEMGTSAAFLDGLRSPLVNKLLAAGAGDAAKYVEDWFANGVKLFPVMPPTPTRPPTTPPSPRGDADATKDYIVQILGERSMDATSVARSVRLPLEVVQRVLTSLEQDRRVLRLHDGAYTKIFHDVDNETLNKIMVRLMTERPVSRHELVLALPFSKDPPYRGKKVENHHRIIRQHEPVQVAHDAYGKKLWFIIPGQKPPPNMNGMIQKRVRTRSKSTAATAAASVPVASKPRRVRSSRGHKPGKKPKNSP